MSSVPQTGGLVVSNFANIQLDLGPGHSARTRMDEVIAAMRAERGFLMLRNSEGRLEFQVARGMDQRTIDAPEFQISRGVVNRVSEEGQPRLTSDAQDRRLAGPDGPAWPGWVCGRFSASPLQFKGATTGVIYVDSRLQAGVLWRRRPRPVIHDCGRRRQTAIENARLYQVAVEKGRLEQELVLARTVQASLIPAETPHLRDGSLPHGGRRRMRLAADFYDMVAIATPTLKPVWAWSSQTYRTRAFGPRCSWL